MDDKNISQLMEMGFSYEQSAHALKSSNNNVKQALGYLFQDPIEVPDEPKEEPANPPYSYEDTVAIQNAHDIPNFSTLNNSNNMSRISSRNSPTMEDYDYDKAPPYTDLKPLDPEPAYHSVWMQIDSFGRTELSPPTILPNYASHMENYIIPFLVVSSQIDQFKHIILSESQDFDYGYDKNWYNPDSKLETETVPQRFSSDHAVSAYKFVVELQRLVAFLSPSISTRAFVTSANLVRNLPRDFRSDLVNRVDDIEDFVRKLYWCLNVNLDTVFASENKIKALFESAVESVTDGAADSIYILPIDAESRGSNIYACLNSMFWSDQTTPGNIRLTKVAPVLTIQLCADDAPYDATGAFDLDETFYPELYSSKYAHVVKGIHDQYTQLSSYIASQTRSLMNLSSFEGKKIKTIVKNTTEYFKGIDSDTANDLARVTEQMQRQSEEISNKLSEARNNQLKNDITNHQNLLNKITSETDSPTPYTLLGVIISDIEYFYRSKNYTKEDEPWVYFKADCDSRKKVLDYSLETMDFNAVKTFIAELTATSSPGLVLMYASEEVFNEKLDVIIPSGLTKFYEKDNTDLSELIRSSYDSSDSDKEDNGSDEEMNEEENEAKRLVDL